VPVVPPPSERKSPQSRLLMILTPPLRETTEGRVHSVTGQRFHPSELKLALLRKSASKIADRETSMACSGLILFGTSEGRERLQRLGRGHRNGYSVYCGSWKKKKNEVSYVDSKEQPLSPSMDYLKQPILNETAYHCPQVG
jgi:hypothetical protein